MRCCGRRDATDRKPNSILGDDDARSSWAALDSSSTTFESPVRARGELTLFCNAFATRELSRRATGHSA